MPELLGVDESHARIERFIGDILSSDEIERISLDDPRFSWLLNHPFAPEGRFRRLGDYVSALRSADGTPERIELLRHIKDYIGSLQADVLEGELAGIVSAMTESPDDVEIVLAELNWSGRSAGESSDLVYLSPSTAEMVRRLSLIQVWTPVLDRALNVVARHAPLSASGDEIGALLNRAGLLEATQFSASGLINAQDGLRRPVRLRLSASDGTVFAVRRSSERSIKAPPSMVHTPELREAHTDVAKTREVIPDKKEDAPLRNGSHVESESVREAIEFAAAQLHQGTGIVQRSKVVDSLKRTGKANLTDDRLCAALPRMTNWLVLADGWMACTDDTFSHISDHIRKILSVCLSIPLDILQHQLTRENRHYKDIPLSTLRAFLESHDDFDVDNGRVLAAPRKYFRISDTLKGDEKLIYNALAGSNQPLSGNDIPGAIVGRHTVHARDLASILRSSSVIVTVGGGRFTALKPSSKLFEAIQSSLSPGESNLDRSIEPQSRIRPEPSPTKAILEDEIAEDDGTYLGEERLLSDGSTKTELRSLGELISDIHHNRLRLPEIQRGYVWKSTQVRDLLDSLYRGYPIGTMLVWKTTQRLASRGIRDSSSVTRQPDESGESTFILDGQQRLTSIVRAIVTGESRIVFNVETEMFRNATIASSSSVRSISVREIFQSGPERVLEQYSQSFDAVNHPLYLSRLQRVKGILQRIVPVETLEGFSYEDVTDVFIRVNSRGTRLKAAELAIADIAYRMPGVVSQEIEHYADQLADRGWEFPVQFLLRTIAAIATGHAGLKSLSAITDEEFEHAWKKLPIAMDAWLSLVTSKLGIASSDVLVGLNNHIVPIVWFADGGDRRHDDRLVEWFVHSSVWSRYSGAAESSLDQDLRELRIERRAGPFHALMERVKQRRPSLRVSIRDIEGAGQKSPLVLLMYLAMASATADDLLAEFYSAPLSGLEEPRATLKPLFSGKSVKASGAKESASQLANMVFVTETAADRVKSADVVKYLDRVPQARLEAFSIPTNQMQWKPLRYQAFLNERTRLLVDAMNDVIKSLTRFEYTPAKPLTVDRPSAAPAPATRVSRGRTPFDASRRELFLTIEEKLQAWNSEVERIERTTYIGFKLKGQSSPFVTVARRKTSLVLTMDCNIKEIHDPQRWCRDVSKLGKHGYGDTQFSIEGSHQLPYTMGLIKQAYDLNS